MHTERGGSGIYGMQKTDFRAGWVVSPTPRCNGITLIVSYLHNVAKRALYIVNNLSRTMYSLVRKELPSRSLE